MTLLNRYILKNFVRILVLSLAAFVGIYLLIDFFEHVNDFINYKAPFSLYLLYFLNKTPLVVSQVIPIAVLMATFLTLGGLSRTNELTAMRSCGISVWRVALPLLGAALLISLGVLAMNEYIVPLNARQVNHILDNQLRGRPTVALKRDKIWFREGNSIINIRLAYPEKGVLHDISIYTLGPQFHLLTRTDARQAVFSGKGWLFKGITRRFFDPATGELTKVEHLRQARLPLHKTPRDFQATEQKNDELNYVQLHDLARQLRAEGYTATRYRVDMQSRLAAPFVCLIMAFLGIPFALQKGRGASLTVGIAISVAIGVSFYILRAMLLAFGYSAVIPPVVAAWSASLLFTLLGCWLLLSSRS